jgi:hypothetical protein
VTHSGFVGTASVNQLFVADAVGAVGFFAEAFFAVDFIVSVVAGKPLDVAIAFEGHDVRGDAV